MSKTALIIKREYKTRVMKPSFIILTFLTPILIAALVLVPLLLAQIKDDAVKKIIVIDRTGLYTKAFEDNEEYQFIFLNQDIEFFKETKIQDSYSAVLYIPEDLSVHPKSATIFSEEQVGMEVKSYLVGILKDYVEEQKIAELNIPDFKELVENTKVDIDVKTVRWGKDGEEKMGSAELALIIGMISAFIIYMFIVVYGAQVMSGVVQEKTSRIVEVIISSVKPFQLMMGKIIGIAMVGLTQFALWVVLSLVLVAAGTSLMGGDVDVQAYEQSMNVGVQSGTVDAGDTVTSEILMALTNFDFVQTGVLFVIFFLGGYLLYASLFAAVGSAVDNETDTQQFSLPLTLPIIFAIYAAIYSAQNPDGPLAFWCSMIPFTSPIVMMVRLPFGVPFWQLALSIGILILSFVGSTWIAGKIYRTGILMYGKKISWKEMMKWVLYKD
ncbi:MAG TPA: ABC transporter permease [Paludibacter sp.]|nr:ABC transporter permease [Paludibacter sp.]HOS46566.1 ABC transporter permease [Paludibacter sp.]HPM10183.1 ABC transporter permease [Paludibacter sp.]